MVTLVEEQACRARFVCLHTFTSGTVPIWSSPVPSEISSDSTAPSALVLGFGILSTILTLWQLPSVHTDFAMQLCRDEAKMEVKGQAEAYLVSSYGGEHAGLLNPMSSPSWLTRATTFWWLRSYLKQMTNMLWLNNVKTRIRSNRLPRYAHKKAWFCPHKKAWFCPPPIPQTVDIHQWMMVAVFIQSIFVS